MNKPVNAGYTIEEQMTIKGNTYVMGHNPKAPAPYVTWAYVPDRDYYTFGHYFSSEADARSSMIRRAMEHLPEKEHNEIVRGIMGDDLKSEIMEEGRMENRLGDIDSCLRDALGRLGVDEDRAETIMADDDFIRFALHRYHGIDHSAENEALSDSLEDLLQERFPQYLAEEQDKTSSLDDIIQSAEGRKIHVTDREPESQSPER